MQKDLLVNALEKMYDVSTKALIPGYNFSGRVTIEVQTSKVLFASSNGCISVQTEVTKDDDPNIAGADRGVVTTDSVKLRDAVRKIATEKVTTPIELFDDGNMLLIRDAESKRKKLVKLPRESDHHKLSIIKKPDGDSVFLETDHFLRSIRTVVPFQSTRGYKLEYQVVCFHWIGKDVRVICGDCSLFAVFTFPRHSKDMNKREMKRLIPCAQLSVMSSLVVDASELELVWKDKSTLWIKGDGIEMIVRGIPDIDYVDYNKHAYRFDEANAYADVKISDLTEVSELLGVLRDKEREEQGKCHSCMVTAPSIDDHIKFEITKDQGKFQCEYEIPATYHDLGDQPGFKSRYAHLFFDTPVHVARHPYLRFYLIKEIGTVNVRDVDLGDPDDNGVPVELPEPDNCSLSFFFASVKDDEEDE
jgi:DNA polymerase III sliding clamp (beta) subunit (PCNA family)